MRLSSARVALLARSLSDLLIDGGLLVCKKGKVHLSSRIEALITDDLRVEERLNAEVKQILKQYEREIEEGAVDYQKMFSMVKKQLIKDRHLTL